MDDINAIISFSSALARQLDSPHRLAQEVDYTVLDFAALPLTVVIYHSSAVDRLTLADKRLIHLDEEDLISDSEKIRMRIVSLFHRGRSYFARQTVVARIDKKVTMDFLVEHHINMAVPGKYRYGLYEQGELVSIAVFSGGRKMVGQAADYRSFELIRFCHQSGVRVVGGLSKLIKAFVADFTPGDIVTYVDRDWSQDSSLQTIGFVSIDELAPQYMVFEDGVKRAVLRDIPIEDASNGDKSSYIKRNAGSIKMKLTL